MEGKYIILEGIVRTGKTTQATRLFEYLKRKYPNVVLIREPGGTEIAEAIRKLVQASNFEEIMDYISEAYLYAAARAQSLRKTVWPVLEKGGIVISDRSFLSSLAYQGYARGLGIKKVLEINKVAIEKHSPDLILYLDLDPDIGLKRILDKEGDKFETKNVEFFKTVEKGYKEVSNMPEFKNKWINIDASGSKDMVFERILNKTNEILPF